MNGRRTSFTNLDFAGLQDLGWKVTKSINLRPGTSPQSAHINTAFTTPLAVQILDFSAKPVANLAVTFTAPLSGAGGTFTGGVTKVTVNTNAAGVATAPTFTANGTTGAYNVVVSARGLTLTKNFALTNTAPAISSMPASVIGNTAPALAPLTRGALDSGAQSSALPRPQPLPFEALERGALLHDDAMRSVRGAKAGSELGADALASLDLFFMRDPLLRN